MAEQPGDTETNDRLAASEQLARDGSLSLDDRPANGERDTSTGNQTKGLDRESTPSKTVKSDLGRASNPEKGAGNGMNGKVPQIPPLPKALEVFERLIPRPPSPTLPTWKDISGKRRRSEDEEEVPLANRKKRRRSEELSNGAGTRDGKVSGKDSAAEPGSAPAESATVTPPNPSDQTSPSNDTANLQQVQRRPSSTAIAERGRHHKHEAEKLGRGEAAEKTLRNLHYLAAATFFIENALRNPALDKVTQDFMVHVLRSLASDDAVIVDLGKRLDALYSMQRCSRRQAQVENLATTLQQNLMGDVEGSWKTDAEKLCQQVLFFKEEYSGAKAKWREIDNAKVDPPPETSRLSSFTESGKFLSLTRQILEATGAKKGFPFSIQ